MTVTHEIWKICTRCDGAGEINTKDPENSDHLEDLIVIECPVCEGEGRHLWGKLKEV